MTDGDRLTSTQRGKIAELHVATALMAQTGGRLSPFEPLSDDHGVDLVVLDKVTGASLPIQVKSWFLSPDKPTNRVQFDVQKTTHSTGQRGAVVCVVVDPSTLAISVGWVIPLGRVASVGTDQPTKYAIAPSRLATSNDKYTEFRCHTLSELAEAVNTLLL